MLTTRELSIASERAVEVFPAACWSFCYLLEPSSMLMSLMRRLKASSRSSVQVSRKERRFNESLKLMDEQARETVLRTRQYTLLKPEKLCAFIEAVRYIHRFSIHGDIVECGVWRGGAIMAAALTLIQLDAPVRRFYLYDTFCGMTKPTHRDRPMPGTPDLDVAQKFRELRTGDDSSSWCYASEEEVRRNLTTVPYAQENFTLVAGKVEETLKVTRPESIAILRLDTDWYESTRVEMEFLMPLLVPRGVLIVDDYYKFKGNKDAVDEYISRNNIPILLTRVGNSAMGVLPC